jgi:DNA-binding XRE family transcriptional regulator
VQVYGKVYGASVGRAASAGYDECEAVNASEALMINAVQLETCDGIRSLLKYLRRRLDPATPTLGEHERLNTRRGRPVTQEELAEAVGVSRCWYSMLERGESIQPSVAMLNRLACALNATRDERVALFRLAIPELQEVL